MEFQGNPIFLSELLIFTAMFLIFPPIMIYMAACHVIDYRILKKHYLRQGKWDLNICCGNTDGGGVNADIVERDVPNFALVEDIYKLPFRDGQFDRTLCSHTIEHVEDPDRFHRELQRVSRKVIYLIPPIWDIVAMQEFKEHKWQFVSLKSKHVNSLPGKFRLPFWRLQEKYGQQYRC